MQKMGREESVHVWTSILTCNYQTFRGFKGCVATLKNTLVIDMPMYLIS